MVGAGPKSFHIPTTSLAPLVNIPPATLWRGIDASCEFALMLEGREPRKHAGFPISGIEKDAAKKSGYPRGYRHWCPQMIRRTVAHQHGDYLRPMGLASTPSGHHRSRGVDPCGFWTIHLRPRVIRERVEMARKVGTDPLVTFRLPADERDRLNQAAARAGGNVSRSDLIRTAVAQMLGEPTLCTDCAEVATA